MQDCFRQHPDVYGEELDGEDADGEELDNATSAASNSHDELSKNKPTTFTSETPYNKARTDQEQLSTNLKADVAVPRDQEV